MNDEKVIDLSYLRDISMGDNEMIMEMIDVFLEGYDDAISEMRAHYVNEQWDELRAKAHKFKPNLAYMGIARGTEKIEELEMQAKEHNSAQSIDSELNELESICEQASSELRQELNDMNVS